MRVECEKCQGKGHIEFYPIGMTIYQWVKPDRKKCVHCHGTGYTAILGFDGDDRWLSNFAITEPFQDEDGIEYTSVETYYCGRKTMDMEQRRYIATLTPGKAKRYCNERAGNVTLPPHWNDQYRVTVMRSGLGYKFSQPHYRGLLLATDKCHIEETNTWGDTFWGVCDGKGQNVLGELLMAKRREILIGGK